MRRSRWSGERWRLAVVVVLGALLAGLGQFSLSEASHRHDALHVHAVAVDGRLVVSRVHPSGAAWDRGIRPGDLIVSVDGRPASSLDGPDVVVTAASLGVQTESGRAVVTSWSPVTGDSTGAPRRVAFTLLASCFVVVGSLVFLLASNLVAASVILAFATTTAATLLAAIPNGVPWAYDVVALGVVGTATTTFLLFLVFPIDRLGSRLGRAAALGSLAAGGSLAGATVWALVFDPRAYDVVRLLVLALTGVEALGACVLVVIALAQTSPRQREAHRALKLVALGTLGGVVPFVALVLLPSALGKAPLAPPDMVILSFVLIPLSLGAAVLSRQFLGVERLARRSLVALVTWLVLLVAYGVGVGALHGATGVGGAPPSGWTWWGTIALVAITGTFPFLQRQLRQLIERLVFRDVYRYSEVLQQFSAEIVRLRGAETIARHFLMRLAGLLDVTWGVIALETADSAKTYSWGSPPPGLTTAMLREGEPSATAAEHVAPLVVEGGTVGVLALGPKRFNTDFTAEDVALISVLAPMLATALQNATLVEQLRTQVATLGERERALAALSARLMTIQEEERRRIALELHDDPLQRAILLARELSDRATMPPVERCRQALDEIVVSLRAICVGLRPRVLDDFGLVAGLEWLVSDLRARSDLTVYLEHGTADGSPFGRLPGDLELALYRVAQESLSNCLKHARATRVTVTLARDEHGITLSVADDGRGIDASAAGESAALHLGILGMAERLRAWGGHLSVTTNAAGGTTATAAVPLGVGVGD